MPIRKEKLREWRLNNKDKINASKRKYYARNKKRLALRMREYNKKNRMARRCVELKSKYGITDFDYIIMYQKQSGMCGICGIPKSLRNVNGERHGILHIDHCHKTNKVRGLLCYRCNTLIGYALEKINILESAIAYIGRSQHA